MTGVDVEAVLRMHLGDGSDDCAECCACATVDEYVAHVAAVFRVEIEAWLAPVVALADQWNDTPDYTPSTYDLGRVDQRHDMTTQLLEVLAELNPYRPTLAADEGGVR